MFEWLLPILEFANFRCLNAFVGPSLSSKKADRAAFLEARKFYLLASANILKEDF